MAKTKKAKINQPKKVKGGNVVGKEGEIWFALKCLNFNKTECSNSTLRRRVKTFLRMKKKRKFLRSSKFLLNKNANVETTSGLKSW